MPTYTFDQNAVRRHLNDTYFNRGKSYFYAGAVSNITLSQTTIKGTVAGRRAHPYSTSLVVGPSNNIASSKCTCPMGGYCKHVAALAMAALDHLAKGINQTLYLSGGQKSANSRSAKSSKPSSIVTPSWQQRLTRAFGSQFMAAEQENELEDSGDQSQLRFILKLIRYQDQLSELEIRPYCFFPDQNRGSLSAIDWRNYGYERALDSLDLPMAHKLFFRQLAVALGLNWDTPSWAGIDHERAAYVWPLLQQAATRGIRLVHGKKYNNAVTISQELLHRTLVITQDKTNFHLAPTMRLGNKAIARSDVLLMGRSPIFGVYYSPEGNMSLHLLANETLSDNRGLDQAVVIPRRAAATFQTKFLPILARQYTIEAAGTNLPIFRAGNPTVMIDIQGAGPNSIKITPRYKYESKTIPWRKKSEYVAVGRRELLLRNKEAEQQLREYVEETLAPIPQAWHQETGTQSGGAPEIKPRLKQSFKLQGFEAVHFIDDIVPRLQEDENILVHQDSSAPVFTKDESEPEISFVVGRPANHGEPDWFDLGIEVAISGEKVPFADIFTALTAGQDELLLASGHYCSLTQPAFNKLRDLIEESRTIREATSQGLTISRFQYGWFEELTRLGVIKRQVKAWHNTMANLKQATGQRAVRPPAQLKTKLRPYQKTGFSWLTFLHQHKLGGILADDMGLGKTVQTIAFMLRVAAEKPRHKPFLVIAPTSVVDNWDSELERFAPNLKRVTMRAGNRDEHHQAAVHTDVIITSYALLVRDFIQLSQLTYDTLILDEAQYVKNHQAKVYAHTRQLQAGCRLALSGTPLENNLLELWAIFSIVAPGLFPNPRKFKQVWQTPIEKQANHERIRELRTRIKPFLLRRTKEQVERDLPAKTIDTLSIALHPKHQRIYQLHLQRERQRVLGLLAEGGLTQHRWQILKSLTRLRQLALAPELIDDKRAGTPNSKLDELIDQITSLTRAGHRALVYSQFTSFLSLVKARLDREKIDYFYLDGRTRQRGALVEKWQSPQGPPVFVISLKAGGIGLNLTAADYVFILDPWWNPAVELQAIDRTHRIGQTKSVMVYKMIARNTIEEKVLALQKKKYNLFNTILQEGKQFNSLITNQDIKNLFEV